jgi:hypothetical protein
MKNIDLVVDYEIRAKEIREQIDDLWAEYERIIAAKKEAEVKGSPLTIEDLTDTQIMNGAEEYLRAAATNLWNVFDRYEAGEILYHNALNSDEKDIYDAMSWEQQKTLVDEYRNKVEEKIVELLQGVLKNGNRN